MIEAHARIQGDDVRLPQVCELAEPPLEHGAIVGEYRLQRRLGSGAAGHVWLGWHLRSDMPAAIKLLDSTHASGKRRTSEREWRAVERLSHPNIVSLYEMGPSHLVMAYIDGPNLEQRLQSPMEPASALRVAEQLAAALAHAHANGVVHRDVKPANVLIDAGGSAYLTDFGIAIMTGESASGVHRGGTPGYMAPEQNHRRIVGPAADQYGLARTLLDMLIGGRAPENRDEALRAISPRSSQSSRELREVLSRALEERPEDRWPSVSDFAARLGEIDLEGVAPLTRLAEEIRSPTAFGWCGHALAVSSVSPRIGRAEYSLTAIAKAGQLAPEALRAFRESTGYADVGFTAFACTDRLGPIEDAAFMSRVADVIVLLHGTANTGEVWRETAIAIARENAEALVLVPDILGFGASRFEAKRPAPRFLASTALVGMIEQWLGLLGLGDFPTVLVGHSAAAAQLMVVTDESLGEHVTRVALTPVFPFASRTLRFQLHLGALLFYLLGRTKLLKRALCRLLVAYGPATAAFSAQERRGMEDATFGVPWYVLARLSIGLARARPAGHDHLDRCAILVGKEDPLAPEKEVLEVLGQLGIPDRNVYKLASGGHMPQLTEDANPGWRTRNVDGVVRVISSMLLSSREGLARRLSGRATLTGTR